MEQIKPRINLAFIGHVGSGKSTTAGHLILKRGGIDEKTIEECEKQASLADKKDSRYAWLMDKLANERRGGYSIDNTRRQCESEKFKLSIIDVPGHVDFLKNTITGISQADVAVLVVDAVSFEENMAKDGQVQEHLLLAYTLGVKQVIVVINKIDDETVEFSEARYKEIREELSEYLRKVGYKPMRIPFIPLSGLHADNLTDSSSNISWYSGPTLLEAVDAVTPPKRAAEKPLRIPIESVRRKDNGAHQLFVAGKVETGIVSKGMKVFLAPSGTTGIVASVEIHHEGVDEGRPGDLVEIGIYGEEVAKANLNRGDMVSNAEDSPAFGVTCFQAQVIVMNHPGKISCGYTPVIDVHTAHMPCKFSKIHQKLDRRTGKVLEIDPQSIQSGDACLVDLEPTKSLCVDTFAEFSSLGRFVIRDQQQTIAVGVIKSIVSRD